MQVGRFAARGGPSALNEHGLQPGSSSPQLGRTALAGTLVVARTQTCPRAEMGGGGEPAHVGADLRYYDLSAELTDPGDSAQLLDGVTKAGERGIGFLIYPDNGRIESVDLLQMEPE